MSITLVTGNPHKAEEFSKLLGVDLAIESLELPEIQSLSIEKIVEAKAIEAYRILQKPVIVEDSSLTLLAMNGLPGPLVKWFEASIGVEGICVLAAEYNDNRAVAASCVAYHDGTQVHISLGETIGRIAAAPRGENGFGWDSIFQPEEDKRVWAEMTSEEKAVHSMRSKALLALKEKMPMGSVLPEESQPSQNEVEPLPAEAAKSTNDEPKVKL